MVPGSLALIAQAYPSKERGGAIGLWSMASGIASALGPLLGGGVLDMGGASAWRWIFWINPPIGLVTLVLLYGCTRHLSAGRLRPHRRRRRDPRDVGAGGDRARTHNGGRARCRRHARRVDGGRRASWRWRPSCGGRGASSEPMLPMGLFRVRTFVGANVLTFFLYFALAGSLFFLPMTLIEAMGLSETEAGSIYLPLTHRNVSGRPLFRPLRRSHGPRLPITAGSLIVAASFLLIAVAVHLGAFACGRPPGDGHSRPRHGPRHRAAFDRGDDLDGRRLERHRVGHQQWRRPGRRPVRRRRAGPRRDGPLLRSLWIPPSFPQSYGEPVSALADAARSMRAEAMMAAFSAVSIVTAVLSAFSAAWSPGGPSAAPRGRSIRPTRAWALKRSAAAAFPC